MRLLREQVPLVMVGGGALEGLSEYELLRQKRMAENQAKLHALGLLQAKEELMKTCREGLPPKKAPVKRPKERVQVEARRSTRERNLPAGFSYWEQRVFGEVQREERKEAPRKRKKTVVIERAWKAVEAGWNLSKGEATTEACDKALAAAEELVRGLRNWACAKVMTPSQVSGGFWCSGPRGLAEALGRTNRSAGGSKISFVVAGDDAGRAWSEIVWLPHGKKPSSKSWGFSGGWRGFAIDMDLYPGDAVAYEVLSPPAPNKPSDTIKIHIFRAFDYEDPTVREQIKAKAAATVVELDGEEEEGEEPVAEVAGAQEGGEKGQRAREDSGARGSGDSEASPSWGSQQGPAAAVVGGLMEVEAPALVEATAEGGGEKEQGTRTSKRGKPQSTLDMSTAAHAMAAGQKQGQKQAQPGPAVSGSSRGKKRGQQAEQQQQRSSKRSKATGAGSGAAESPAAATGKASGLAGDKQQAGKGKGSKGKGAPTASATAAAAKKGQERGGQREGAKEGKQGRANRAKNNEPGPVTDDGGFWVERIEGARWRRGRLEYLIKWWGYDERTWEPPSSLDGDLRRYVVARGVDLDVGPQNKLSLWSGLKEIPA